MALLKPGVVTGKDYLTLVAAAKAGGYALPAVNVSSSSSTNAVLEAAAVGVPDAHYGQEILACIVLRDGMAADEAELRAFCLQHLRL